MNDLNWNVEGLRQAKEREIVELVETSRRTYKELAKDVAQIVMLTVVISGAIFLTLYNPTLGYSVISYIAF